MVVARRRLPMELDPGSDRRGLDAAMKLPGANKAFVDLVKLTDYCLNPVHPRGRHKSHRFATVLGLTADRADVAWMQEGRVAEVRSKAAEGGRW